MQYDKHHNVLCKELTINRAISLNIQSRAVFTINRAISLNIQSRAVFTQLSFPRNPSDFE